MFVEGLSKKDKKLLRSKKFDKKKSALDRAHDIRKFEIDLYWKRTLYFWGFQVAVLAAFALLLDEASSTKPVIVALSLMGVFISFAWYYMSKGGKAWQENWERHIDFLEDSIDGNLHKIVVGNKDEFYSVSRINQDVIKAWGVFWVFALLYSISSLLYSLLQCLDLSDSMLLVAIVVIVAVVIIVAILALICFFTAPICFFRCRWKTNFSDDAPYSPDGIRRRAKKFMKKKP